MSKDMLAIRSYCQDEIIFLQQKIIQKQKDYIENSNHRTGEIEHKLLEAKTLITAYMRVIAHIDAIQFKKHMKQED